MISVDEVKSVQEAVERSWGFRLSYDSSEQLVEEYHQLDKKFSFPFNHDYSSYTGQRLVVTDWNFKIFMHTKGRTIINNQFNSVMKERAFELYKYENEGKAPLDITAIPVKTKTSFKKQIDNLIKQKR
jgi:hypothetical protein